MITVFTPTFNRAYRLPKLYESLCRQTDRDFEWLIVDDGSTDDTVKLVESWIAENRIGIRYHRQDNGGKHRAINRGAEMARGELFFIVDSDDYLTDDALSEIHKTYAEIQGDDRFCGVCMCRAHKDGVRIGGELCFDTLDCSALDFRLKHKITGDMAEVMRTNIMRQFPFPEFEGEKFCPEALVWNRIADNYFFRYKNRKIYICEYLADGLTAGIIRVRRFSPTASMMYYSELLGRRIPLKEKLKSAVNFWRFADLKKYRGFNIPLAFSIITIIPGRLYRLFDTLKIR